MNRIIVTTGMAALGAVALQPALAQEAKPWNVTATVRSFYDDNYTTLPSKAAAGSPTKRSSWGLDISPSAAYQFKRDQTTLDLSSRYGMRYYEDRREGSADHSLDFGVSLSHQFTEKQKLTVSESFAIAQEPGVLDPSSAVSTALRTDGNNLRNNIQLKFTSEDIIERWSGEASYANTYYDYQQDNSSAGGVGSRSALLDRVEHLLSIVGRYRIFDETSTELLFGYSLGLTDSTSKDLLTATALPASRDSRSHYFFTGAGHKFTPELRANGRVGLQYVEYPNAATAVPAFQKSQTSPYVDVSGSWDYLPNSSAQLGVRLARITTDISTSVDAEATTFYSSLNHEFNPDLKGSLLAQFQMSQYGTPKATDNIFTTGVNLEWRFHTFLSLEGGYNYDRQDSDIAGRSYYRNRLYLGFKGTW
jgi:Putative beta-barrel porin 2